MNISFDLDSTLIPNWKEFETEKLGGIAKLFGIEEIRKGTRELFNYLQIQGHQIHIYTTSYRSKLKIRLTFMYYRIKVNRLVNQTENSKVLNALNIHASKYPPAFGFDIHVDDLIGVGMEGEKYDFRVIIVEPKDHNWADKIKNMV
jgi:hypothetical protein